MKVGEKIGRLPNGSVSLTYVSTIEYIGKGGHRITHCFGTKTKLTAFLKSLGYRRTTQKTEEGYPIMKTKTHDKDVRAALLALKH